MNGRLDPADIEAIAERVVALMQQQQPPAQAARFVDAARLAEILDVERDWVYVHAKELHAVRLGGPRGRLRFDLAAVLGDLDGRRPGTLARRATMFGGELLPIEP